MSKLLSTRGHWSGLGLGALAALPVVLAIFFMVML